MPTNPYKTLPLESLYELLTGSVRNTLYRFEYSEYYKIAFKPLKKQIELLIAAIEDKRTENAEKN
jgi:hypothetical protein